MAVQPVEFIGPRRRQKIFSCREDLPQLDEGRPELLQGEPGALLRFEMRDFTGLSPLQYLAGALEQLLERTGQVLQWGQASEVAHLEPQQRARLALEQLGPTFVKLGQILSTREDLLPPAWTDELNRLYSHVAPVPFDDLLPQIEQALGRSPAEVFANLEREPYAAASIAQIHRATLTSGTPVIL